MTINKTGFFWSERCFWHSASNFAFLLPVGGLVEPLSTSTFPETPESKRRLKNLLDVSGLSKDLELISSTSKVTYEDIIRIHSKEYIDNFISLSNKDGGDLGLRAPFGPGGFDIACISASLVKEALFSVIDGRYDNSYALSRPPGHHCLVDYPNGFCLLNNIAISVEAAIKSSKIEKVAIVDWDVHHGNGTESIFYNRSDVLTISIHQEKNYPLDTGNIKDLGGADAYLSNLNIPLFPGGGHSVYVYAINELILPKLEHFNPDIVIVACGYDASGVDPLSRMLCGSDTFAYMTKKLMSFTKGKLVLAHEGGYSDVHVPFCGHSVLQALSGSVVSVEDPLAERIKSQQPDPTFDQLQFKRIRSIADLHGL